MASGVSANATVALASMKLRSDFMFEVADGGGEATVGGHVRVVEQTEPQLEIERLGERLFLKDAGADHLAGDRHQDFVLPCGKDFNLRDLRLLVKLLGLSDQVVAVERGQHGHGDSDKEPEPRQPVALGKQLSLPLASLSKI